MQEKSPISLKKQTENGLKNLKDKEKKIQEEEKNNTTKKFYLQRNIKKLMN